MIYRPAFLLVLMGIQLGSSFQFLPVGEYQHRDVHRAQLGKVGILTFSEQNAVSRN